jgi:choline dehydrogenase
VEFLREGKLHRIRATREVVLSLGAIHTPKLLMHPGIGDEAELKRVGIPLIEHLPGIGRNFQDHFMSPCVWEAREPTERRNNLAEATAMWKSDAALDIPDLQSFMVEAPYASPQAAKVAPPPNSWSLTTAVLRTASRGRLRLTGADPRDPIDIDANVLDDPADLKALNICVEFCRAISNSVPLRRFAKREILPGPLEGAELEDFIRNATVSHSHQTCTAKSAMPCQSWTTVVQPDDRCARNFMPSSASPPPSPSGSDQRVLVRISDFSTFPTLERGRSSQTSICLGVLTLPVAT